MTTLDDFALDDGESGGKKPCGCQENMAGPAGDWGDALPPPEELERALGALGAEAGSLELDLEDDDVLSLEASLDMLEEGDSPDLPDLVRVLEQYPGLKITLSFD